MTIDFRVNEKNMPGESSPLVSILIPVFNEEKYIDGCIQQVLAQTYPHSKIEILVIDGMSSDKTREKVEAWKKKLNSTDQDDLIDLRVIENTRRFRASGLNIGIFNANGDVLLRLDARTRVKPDYVKLCVDTLLSTGAQNVGGLQIPEGETPTQKGIALAMSHPFGVGNAQFRLGKKSGFVDTVYLGCYPKGIFDKVGMFDEDSSIISEESDMNQRIHKVGGRVYLNPEIKAYYSPRDTLKALWDLYFRYGGARAGNFLKHKQLTSWRQSVPPAMLAVLVVSGILSFFSIYSFYLFAGVLSLYALCNAIFSVSLSFKAKRPLLAPIVFSAFFCMHFGWSSGFYRRLFSREKAGTYWAN